jgi:teichuronic acid biosynthesis glycosyltransferase TuaC
VRVLVLSTVYPNPSQPAFGIFIHERIRRIAGHCDLQVMAPTPWFPLNTVIRGGWWRDVPPVEIRDGVRVHHPRFLCIPRYAKWLDGTLYAASLAPVLYRLRQRFPFDLIDAHFAYPDGMAAVLLGAAFRCPVVITLRGSIVRLARYPLHRPQLRFALRRAARVVAVSESLRGAAADLGIPPGKIRVIPNGVDTERFRPRERLEARRMLNLPPHRPIILSVGGINEGKGHHRVAGIVPSLLADWPDLLYVIVGGERPGDSSRLLIERTVARLGLERHVLLVGEQPPERVALWGAAADLFCLATRSEGWANVLLEALACGTPVVTTRVGGNAEIVTSDALGTLVSPADDTALAGAILDALRRPWDRQVLVDHARRHSWDAAAAGVLEEFGRALDESAPSAATPPATGLPVTARARRPR